MFAILGATGQTGSVVAETLLAQKQQVRVIVRSAEKGARWKAQGAEVAIASYEAGAALTDALKGARGVYLLVPPNYPAAAWLAEQRRAMDNAAAAVRAGGVEHVVFLSSIGAQLPEGTGPIRASRYGEQVIGKVARHVTILRPPYFMENWIPVLGLAKAQSVLPTFLAPGTKIPMISTRDIGRIAAEQLIAGGQGRKVLELTGPQEYSPNDVAAALGVILSRTVTAQQASLDAVVPMFKSLGVSDEAAKLFEEMYRSLGQGVIRYEQADSAFIRGRVTLAEAIKSFVQAG